MLEVWGLPRRIVDGFAKSPRGNDDVYGNEQRFHMHMCSEEYPYTEESDEEMEALGKDWKLVRVMFSGECEQYFA